MKHQAQSCQLRRNTEFDVPNLAALHSVFGTSVLNLLCSVLIGAWCFSTPTVVWAHDPGLSIATAKLSNGTLALELGVSRSDIERLVTLDANHDGQVTDAEFTAASLSLRKIASEAFKVRSGDRELRSTDVKVQRDTRDGIRFDLLFSELESGRLTIRSVLLERLPRGHRQFVAVRDERGTLLAEQMLDVRNDQLSLHITAQQPVGTPHSFRQFVALGVSHIATGYDHLLFLFGLLLVGGSLRSALQIVTSFTCAHSITLALAALNVINISPRIIEPLIAASIVYVGLDNILRPDLRGRWMLTFGFGLIHGCGFASALRDLGLGANGMGVILPLVSFNLGVELGQLAIVALVLPLIWRCRRSPAFVARLCPAGSCLIALVGGYWVVERTLF